MTEYDSNKIEPDSEAQMQGTLGRRDMLKAGIGTMAALASSAIVLEPLYSGEAGITFEKFFQKHYTKLTPEMLDKILIRIEDEIGRNYGAKVQVSDPKPIAGVEFAYALNISRCNGSRRCVTACMRENNIPPDRPEMAYIRVHELPNDSLDLYDGDPTYDHDQVPHPQKYYLPVQCHQCRNSPCTDSCPTNATWEEEDGVVVVDYDWCIGCRYCIAACPYETRRFNWDTPQLKPEDINPNMAYLTNRIRPQGVVEKCHFCLHRTRRGLNPACMEACPTGARVFGNLRDPDGPIQQILREKRVYILNADAKTIPRFYYFFDK